MDHGAATSLEVVREVAAREGVSPVELTPPLYDVVDTDALDALFRPAGADVTGADVSLEFSYCGYDVRVEGPGRVTVRDGATVADGSDRSTGGATTD